MKREVKIILVSGISITINENDKVNMIYETGVIDEKDNTEECAIVEIEDIKDIPGMVMFKQGDIILQHKLSTGEYMEYYLTRDKITWCYYSEVEEKENENK